MRLTFLWAIRLGLLGLAVSGGAWAQSLPALLMPQRGLASWYGGSFHGQTAASGEVFDQEQLTAAHRTLPFGTRVLVRNIGSGSSVVVRINDRGPFVESRIIDLSYAAARRLGMTQPGLVPVSIELAESAIPLTSGPLDPAQFSVLAGTFRNYDNARRAQALMMQKFGDARIVPTGKQNGLWSVLVGKAENAAGARAIAEEVRITAAGFESAYVVKADGAR